MCGITGFIGFNNHNSETLKNIAYRMAKSIQHRGPDNSGFWSDEKGEIALAHQRLSILDLSSAGNQPMESRSQRYMIVFNGEIYNHLELRNDLEKMGQVTKWRGYSDTETLLAGFEAWGISSTLNRVRGMFAFALWDSRNNELYLARDRMGEKPLYYGVQGRSFIFASELKSFKEHPEFRGEIDRDSITLQLRHNCIPAPFSIYKGVKKLLPGNFLKLRVEKGKITSNNVLETTAYWSLEESVENGIDNPFEGSEIDATEVLHNLLLDSVKQQMISDVPLGAFLSGGIDSSLIVSLMQKLSSNPIRTFSIGFNEKAYNEAQHAKEVAQYLGTDHTELYLSANQALDVIPQLSTMYDEPFSDSSQIPTYLLSKMTREHVTVSLSGDGGDELFGGYNRYFKTNTWWNRIKTIPKPLRSATSFSLLSVRPAQWRMISSIFESLTNKRGGRWNNLENTVIKMAGALSVDNEIELYRYLTSHWEKPQDVVINSREPETQITNAAIDTPILAQQMMYLDALTYLPDDILAKVDRAAMSVSLETRIPMLDHKIVEFSWRLPFSYKINGRDGKWILRNILNEYVPKELIDRPKMGFAMPIDSWLRGPLREWAEDLIDESRLKNEGFFEPTSIRSKWIEHIKGKRNWQHELWDILMFQAWLEKE